MSGNKQTNINKQKQGLEGFSLYKNINIYSKIPSTLLNVNLKLPVDISTNKQAENLLKVLIFVIS